MIKEKIKLQLPEGIREVDVMSYEDSDKEMLREIFKNWKLLCENLKSIGSRTIPVPEELILGITCIDMNLVRICRDDLYFDCYDMIKNKRIKIKSISSRKNFISISKKDTWDQLYFLDIYNNGKYRIYVLERNELLEESSNNRSQFRINLYEVIGRLRKEPLIISNIFSDKGTLTTYQHY